MKANQLNIFLIFSNVKNQNKYSLFYWVNCILYYSTIKYFQVFTTGKNVVFVFYFSFLIKENI